MIHHEPVDVRVFYPNPSDNPETTYANPVQRTPAQQHLDEALDKAAQHADNALAEAQAAVDWLTVVAPIPTTRNVATYIRQLIDEIVEVRRLRQ